MKRKKPLARKKPLKRTEFKRKPSQSQFKPKPRKAKPKKPPKPKAGESWYKDWGASHDECQCCGIGKALAERVRFPGLSTHHIAKAGRVHTATNVIRLCQRCHNSAENLTVAVFLPNGKKYYYPALLFAHCHWLKIDRSPEEYDAETLKRLRLGHLTEPVEPHAVYQAEWLARQGREDEAAEKLASSDFPGTLYDLLHAELLPQ